MDIASAPSPEMLAPRPSTGTTGDLGWSQFTLGLDPVPQVIIDRAQTVLTIAEAKIALVKSGQLSVGELNDYEWVVHEEPADPEAPDHRTFRVDVQGRIA